MITVEMVEVFSKGSGTFIEVPATRSDEWEYRMHNFMYKIIEHTLVGYWGYPHREYGVTYRVRFKYPFSDDWWVLVEYFHSKEEATNSMINLIKRHNKGHKQSVGDARVCWVANPPPPVPRHPGDWVPGWKDIDTEM
jgi:hypothetical protein